MSIIAKVLQQGKDFGWKALQQQCDSTSAKQTLLVDYSSPNVAKPFHAGHLRATLLGSFVYRVNKSSENMW